jgi:signal transduction histidine kinase
MGYDCVSFLTDSGAVVVHLVLDRPGYSVEIERTADGLGLAGKGLRLSVRDHSAPQEKPFFDRLRPKDTFARPLPLPLDSLQLFYTPSPGQLPPRFQGFEIISLTTFTWSVVVLVLTLIVGVIFILRSVLHERRTARLKTDFVSFISHELKTPLTSIRLYTETLLDGRVANQEEQTVCLQMVDKESLRLSQLIDQILRYSQLERHQKQFFFTSCSMRDVVAEAVRVFKGYKEGRDREVEVNSAQQISKIRMDRAAIIELLLNFLTNAAKYSPPDKDIVINLRESIDEICVDVVDRGVGIRKRDQKKVFDKFYRSEDYLTRDVEGTGLGLTFARYIAKVHNGEIKVSSQLNGGSTFTLHLRKTQVLAE